MYPQKCNNCGYADWDTAKCRLLGIHIEPKDGLTCTQWKQELDVCTICGKVIVSNPYLISNNDSWNMVCGECVQQLNTCRNCQNSQSCDFETNPSSLPKAVMKRFQQGNQIIQTQIKNEERIRQTCEKNCCCWDVKNRVCRKEYNYCEDIVVII